MAPGGQLKIVAAVVGSMALRFIIEKNSIQVDLDRRAKERKEERCRGQRQGVLK
jgi:hypothetical protein